MPSMTADRLLDGPRGQRLVFAFAVEAGSRSLQTDAHHAAAVFDPPESVVRISSDGTHREAPQFPVVSLADLSARLRRTPVPTARPDSVLSAFDHSVSSAQYWQVGDGTAQMLATGDLTDALRPFAEAIVASAATAWWSTDHVADDQFEVIVSHPASDNRPVRSLADLAARARMDEIAGSRRARDTSNVSGTWWSTPWRATDTVRGRNDLGLRLDLIEDAGGWESTWTRTVRVASDARVLEIQSPDDWARLCRNHPFEITHTVGPDWHRVTGLETRWVMPDWESVASVYDGVHLSVAGYLTSATRAIAIDDDVHTMIAGWRPDGTAWLTDDAVTGSSEWQEWRRDPDTRRWTRI